MYVKHKNHRRCSHACVEEALLKYWGMIPSLHGPMGLWQSGGHHGEGGGGLKMAGTKIARRNSVWSTE